MKKPLEVLARSRALWNREGLALESDEVLAQILDRGSLDDWRALYQLLREASKESLLLRDRVSRLLYLVPTGRPHLWLAALESIGHQVDWEREPKRDPGDADI